MSNGAFILYFDSIFYCVFHLAGTRAAPREILLDNSILPNDKKEVRVSTPPRMITLSEHHFPSATDDQYTPDEEPTTHEFEPSSAGSIDDKRLTLHKPKKFFHQDLFNIR